MSIQLEYVALHRMNMTLKDPFMTSFGIVQEKDFFIVEVVADDGTIGYGESVAFAAPWYTEETTETTKHMLLDILLPMLRGRTFSHPREVRKLFEPIRRNRMAKAAIESAMWDLYAKQQGIPLAEALGGTKKTIDVGISLGLEPTVEALLEKIAMYVTKGYKRVKIKIKPGMDVELVREVRRAFPDVPLMVDANSAYTLGDIAHLQKLDEFNLLMIEQPLASDDIIDHATLQRKIETPVCLDESIYSLTDVETAIRLGSCKIINVKSGRVGGLEEARLIHDYCEKHGVAVWCGGMLEAGVGRAHNIHLASLSNFMLPGDIGSSSRYFANDIIDPKVVVRNGTIEVPTEPGIGYAIDRAVFEQYRQESITFSVSTS